MRARAVFAAFIILSPGPALAATGLPRTDFAQTAYAARPAPPARRVSHSIPKGRIPLESLARSQGYTLRYDSGPDVYHMTNGSHTIVVGPGMLHALIDGNPYQLGSRPSYEGGRLTVPGTLAGYISRLKSYSTSSRFGYSGKTSVGSVQLRRVVIDPGHGGHDPGAVGRNGVKEKTINLQVAQYLSQILRAKGVQVVMTRTTDRFVDLHQRAHVANNSGADLFVSIHANATRSRWTQGIETYCLSPRISDSSRANRAASQYDARAFGYTYRTASSERSVFRQKLRRDRYLAKRAAGFVQKRMVSASGDTNRGVQTKNLCVLRETYVPAILLEVGFISNQKTEIRFRSPAYQRNLASAIASGLADYSRYHPSKQVPSASYASRPSRAPGPASAGDVPEAVPVYGRSGFVSYARH